MSDHTQTTHKIDFDSGFAPQSLADWQTLAEKSLRGATLDSLAHSTANGLSVQPLYTDRPLATLTLPTQALQRWDNRLAVFGDSAHAQNQHLLSGLQGGISSAQIQLSRTESITPIKVEQLDSVVEQVQLDILPLSLIAGSQFTQAANQMKTIWSNNNLAPHTLSASFNADPIGLLASFSELTADFDSLMQAAVQLASDTSKTHPATKTLSINSAVYHNAGASIEQELVASVATGSHYLQLLIDAGIPAQSAHDTLVFQLACDADTLANVVKLRALKVLWHYVAAHMGVATPALNLVVETSRRMQSRLQVWVNHLRNVSAASAAAMGGAQSIIVYPHNRIDNQFFDTEVDTGNRVARNIPIILSEEAAMTFVHDPLGGSYAIEHLTKDLTDTTWQALQAQEHEGGFIQALTSGSWQKKIAGVHQQRVLRLQEEQDVMVGVNRFNAHLPDKQSPSLCETHAMTNTRSLRPVRDAKVFEDKLLEEMQ